MRTQPFTRPALIAAFELPEGHSQARFNQMVLRLGLEDEICLGTAVSVAKCAICSGASWSSAPIRSSIRSTAA
jgi:hypothetical protein